MAEVQELHSGGVAAKASDKRGKFVRLAEKRTVNAIKAIRVIGKLGNRAHYDYDERDVKKIVAALNAEIETLKVRMTTRGSHDAIEFNL